MLRDAAILIAAGAAAACAAPRAAVRTAASGTIAWEHPVDGGIRGVRYGTGTVMVETDAGLTGLEGRTGRELWRLPIATPGIGRRSCTWDHAFVVCGTEPDAPVQRAVAVDSVSGERKWVFDAPEGVTLAGVFGVRDGVLYAVASGPGNGTREAWAVDTRTRTVRWQVPCDAEGLYVPDAGSLVYSQSPGSGGDLTALDAGTGATVWSRAGDSSVSATTIESGLVGGAVLATDGAHVISGLDPNTGAALWNTPALSYPADTLFGAGDTYYLCDGSKLHAMRPGGDVAPLWSLTVSDRDKEFKAGGYAVTGAVYLLAAGALRAIDPHTSKVRWMRAIPDVDGATVPFAVGDTHCYVESGDGAALLAVER
ncbi:outer membrane protein assembly factor BamB family protein [Nocardia terrae]|uniref:outer membrane protein assembly factor BamB family protein n=1 Tax=Nocardia terrae TaxID=2675851 RepID=UPI0012FC2247|nr:PQQ-binding-like beta-propeller repeat protein [Nocardia terrae]